MVGKRWQTNITICARHGGGTQQASTHKTDKRLRSSSQPWPHGKTLSPKPRGTHEEKNTLSFLPFELKNHKPQAFCSCDSSWNPLTALKNDGLGLVVMCSPSTVDAHATLWELVSKPNKNKQDQAFSVLFD